GLCVYQDMPVLDQLASLAMHVRSGQFSGVLDIGNLYAVKEPSHPVVLAKAPKRSETAGDQGIPDIAAFVAHQIGYDSDFREGMKAYEAGFQHLYADALAAHILGGRSDRDRRNLKLFRTMLREEAFKNDSI
ncbi:MAG: hypothetical protein ACEQSB_07205, partial [Undibacterium sp.]